MAHEKNPNNYELVGEIVAIFQRGQKWHANFQLNGKQQRRSLKTASKKEARRRAIQLEAEILQGRYRHVIEPPALASVIKDYTDFLRTERRAAKTMSKYQKIFARLMDLAERRRVRTIDAVDRRLMDAYRGERVEAGAAPKTVYTESVVIRQLVNFALSRGLITDDPLKGLRLKKPKPSPQPCWTQAEVEKILMASCEPERSRFLVLADSGMRVGELRHLTWDDLDFDRNAVHIQSKDGWQPKTGDRRSIPMTPRVRALLQSLPPRNRWVFTARPSKKYPQGGRQFSDRHLLVSLKRVLKKLGLDGHVHTFRHAFISHALTQGIPEAIVRQWVGHVDAEVIKLYTHIADASSQAAMQRLAGAENHKLQAGGHQEGANTDGSNSAQNQHTEGSQANEHNAN
jgi:site-specific recombinase XerD